MQSPHLAPGRAACDRLNGQRSALGGTLLVDLALAVGNHAQLRLELVFAGSEDLGVRHQPTLPSNLDFDSIALLVQPASRAFHRNELLFPK